MGGGFKSVSIFSGLISGFLRRSMDSLHKPNIEAENLKTTGLLNNIDIISSVSGGSWFIMLLIYSETFREMIENVAKADSSLDAKDIFNEEFSYPQLSTRMHKFENGTDGVNMWCDYNREMFKTGGIDENMVLGDAPQEWANGKILMSNHAIVLRGKKIEAWETLWARRILTWRSQLLYQIELGLVKDLGQGQFLPAAYSVTLGSGRNHPLPVKYISISSDVYNVTLTKAKYQGRTGLSTRINEETPISIIQPSPSTFGDLPIYAAADSSSSLGGLEQEALANTFNMCVYNYKLNLFDFETFADTCFKIGL